MSQLVVTDALLDFLRARSADRDDSGFLLAGPEPPISYMGAGEELVIPETLTYQLAGAPHPLAEELRAAGIGTSVAVIGEARP